MRKWPKRELYAIVERAYSEGIGAHRLSSVTGCSRDRLRRIARELDLPRLPTRKAGTMPSFELLCMIGTMLHVAVDPKQ